MHRRSWDNKTVAQRFEECVSVLSKLPGNISLGHRNYWPEIKYTPREIARMEKTKKYTILQPLPDAIDRAEETLAWITLVDEPERRKLIWLRAQRMSWRAIAREVGYPKTTAQRYWNEALRAISNNLDVSVSRGNSW